MLRLPAGWHAASCPCHRAVGAEQQSSTAAAVRQNGAHRDLSQSSGDSAHSRPRGRASSDSSSSAASILPACATRADKRPAEHCASLSAAARLGRPPASENGPPRSPAAVGAPPGGRLPGRGSGVPRRQLHRDRLPKRQMPPRRTKRLRCVAAAAQRSTGARSAAVAACLFIHPTRYASPSLAHHASLPAGSSSVQVIGPEIVPDKWPGGVDFTDACNAHDDCYGEKGGERGEKGRQTAGRSGRATANHSPASAQLAPPPRPAMPSLQPRWAPLARSATRRLMTLCTRSAAPQSGAAGMNRQQAVLGGGRQEQRLRLTGCPLLPFPLPSPPARSCPDVPLIETGACPQLDACNGLAGTYADTIRHGWGGHARTRAAIRCRRASRSHLPAPQPTAPSAGAWASARLRTTRTRPRSTPASARQTRGLEHGGGAGSRSGGSTRPPAAAAASGGCGARATPQPALPPPLLHRLQGAHFTPSPPLRVCVCLHIELAAQL